MILSKLSAGSLRSMVSLLKFNAPEWPYLLIACIFTIASSTVTTAYAIVLIETIDVSRQ